VFDGFDDPVESKFAGRRIKDYVRQEYRNQRDELVATFICSRMRFERREMQARARNMPLHDAELADARDAKYGSGTISRSEAEAGFEDAMTEVETFAKSRERIHREEWDTLYRSANDAFAVLSNHLDANEPGDREQLESAHRRLQEGLRRVRVRGKKFSDI
jgi:hypothetical protein